MGSYVYDVDGGKKSVRPKVLFIGTHLDNVASEPGRVQAIDRSLQDDVKKTSLYKSSDTDSLVEFASRNQLVFTVNNCSPDYSDLKQLRETVKRIAKQEKYKLDLPSTWLIFSLVLRQEPRKVISFEECLDLAHKCNIESEKELVDALWYLTKAGLVCHFRGEGLKRSC